MYRYILFLFLSASLNARVLRTQHVPPKKEKLFVTDERIFLKTEFLYWRIQEQALDYALTMKQPAWGPTASLAQGDFENAKFDYEPGFRVSAGYYNYPKLWEILAQYTWLAARDTDTATRPNANIFLTGTWPQFTTNPLERAESKIRFRYNLADLLVSRIFDPNPHLRMRLMVGLVFAWINQRWSIRYFDNTAVPTFIKNKWRFNGGGMRLGITGDWFWGNYVFMTGKVTIASLLGHYKNTAFQKASTAINPSDNPDVPIRDAKYKDWRGIFNAQFALGPAYEQEFDGWDIELFAGYELNTWWNLQEIYRSTQTAANLSKETWMNRGLTFLHGLNVSLTIGF